MIRRILAALALLFTLTLTAAQAAPATDIKIAWYGQSMFLIVTPAGTRIVLDPHNLEAYRITPLKADVVLMSHLHTDHTKTEVIENLKDAKQFNAMKKDGPMGLVADWNAVDEKPAKDVRVVSLASYHDQMSGLQRGKNGGWLIDIDGFKIAHLGDLGHSLNKAQLKKIGSVDVVMIPAGGVYTLNGIEAFKVAQQIAPKRWIIPMHYGTIVYDDLLPLKYFTDEAKEAEVSVTTFKPKQWLSIDPKAAAPKQAGVAVLSYDGEPVDFKLKGKDKNKDKEKDKGK